MNKSLLKLSEYIGDLCNPNFKRLEIDHLNYIHRNHNGQVSYLCSNQNWLEHYLRKSYPDIGAFEQKKELSTHTYILWNGLDRNDPILIDSKEILGIEFGITIIKKENDGFGFFNFGVKSSDSSVVNKYINHLDDYENFILYFQEKASSLICNAKKLKFNTSPKTINKKVKPGYRYGNLHLTIREFQCVEYLSRGKTAEEIALIFNISKRTVETHINNIKNKLNCYSQFRLGYLLGKMQLDII